LTTPKAAPRTVPKSSVVPVRVEPPKRSEVPSDWPLTPGVRPPWIKPSSLSVLKRRTEPMWFFFESDPFGYDYSHPLWIEHPNTVMCIRPDCRFLLSPDGKQMFAKARGPHDTVRWTMRWLVELMDRVARSWGPRNRPFTWYCNVAAFGTISKDADPANWPNLRPLLNHPKDRLRSGQRGPFVRNGILEAHEWATEYFEDLANELKTRGLPDPIAFIESSENGVGDDYTGHLGSPDQGWVPEALADPRADDPDETIDGRRTFAEYIHTARALDGGEIPPFDPNTPLAWPPGRSPKNAESSERYRAAIRLAWTWSLHASFGSIAKRVFARNSARPENTVFIGEYGQACDSKLSPVRVMPGIWQHQMDGIFFQDVQCPECYGPISWNKPDDTFGREPGWATMGNWRKVYPNSVTDTKKRDAKVTIDTHIAMATQHAYAAPDKPLMPFVAWGHGIELDEMVEYVRACRDLGAMGVNIFAPAVTPEMIKFWKTVIERTA
jgi:hypothetical protein